MAGWKRPDSVPVPQVWARFEGKKPIGKNGKIPKFKIQDMTEDMAEAVLDHMVTNFLRDEPLLGSKNLKDDPVFVKESLAIWRELFKHKLILVCLLENREELGDNTLPILAGCNLTYWTYPGDDVITDVTNPDGKKLFYILDEWTEHVNCFEKYNVPGFMYAFGLSVDPVFRGQGIGLEILKSRFPLCKAVGIKLTVTVFSAIASQKIAEKAGYELLYECDYDNYKDENGKPYFTGLNVKSIKIMAAKIE